jgi:hypothetical protein
MKHRSSKSIVPNKSNIYNFNNYAAFDLMYGNANNNSFNENLP